MNRDFELCLFWFSCDSPTDPEPEPSEIDVDWVLIKSPNIMTYDSDLNGNGGFIGLFSAIILVILGPTVWVETFGFSEAIFPYKYPGLFSMSISFISIFVISLMDKKNFN